MTFLEFYQARMAVVTPDGDSRRLDRRHKSWVISDLITLQTYAKVFQSGNVSTYLTWTDECGASRVSSPYGTLTGAYVKDAAVDCDSIQCTPVTEIVMRRYMKQWQLCSCTSAATSSGGSGSSGGSSGSSGSGGSFGVLGAAALRLVEPEPYRTYPLLWLNSDGDGMGGWFTFIPTDSHADDGVDYIIPSSIVRPTLGTFKRSSSL